MYLRRLLLWAFVSIVGSAIFPLSASACDYLNGLGGPLGDMLNLYGDAIDLSSPAVEALGRSSSLMAKTSKHFELAGPLTDRLSGMLAACDGIENYNACMSDGFSGSTCAQQALPDALCAISEGLGVNPRNPFSAAALFVPPMCVMSAAYDIAMQPDNPLCDPPAPPTNGGGGLCCCKYPGEDICHSGFCPESVGFPPANCPESLGEVDAQTGTCEHIPECGGEDPNPVQAADAQALQNALNNVSGSFKSFLDANYDRADDGLNDSTEPGLNTNICDRQKLFNLATFKGCRGFDPIMKQAEPYIDSAQWSSPPTAAAKSRTQYDLLATNVAWRLIQGIPNGVERSVNAVGGNGDPFRVGSPPSGYSTQSWIDHVIAERGIDPERELEKWLSPCAIEILKNGYIANQWKLLAIDNGPTRTVVTDDPDTIEDGCYPGEAPSITTLTQSADDKTATLHLVVNDPEYSGGHTTNGNIEVVIDWGEENKGSESHERDQSAQPETNQNIEVQSYNLSSGASGKDYVHAYKKKGQYTVQVFVMNSVGKVARETLVTNFNQSIQKMHSDIMPEKPKMLSLPSY